MTKSDLIERLNVLHLQRVVEFNTAAPADQLRLAKDPSFWRVPHKCEDFCFDGVCLECNRRVRSIGQNRFSVSRSASKAGCRA